ncbi:MAG: hypothetical protein ACRCTJ_05705 [Brevinema sp.]
MTFIILLTSTISIINLYFWIKQRQNKPFSHEITAFKSETQTVMVEFNRITTRNISLLDEKLEELDHKIRISQKIDALLKERIEEFDKISHWKEIETRPIIQTLIDENHSAILKEPKKSKKKILVSDISQQIAHEQTNQIQATKEHLTKNKSTIKDLQKIINKVNTSLSTNHNIIKSVTVESTLFEGVPIQKIKKHQSTHKKHELLLQHLQENKSKEELLALGFSNNEINLAKMSLSLDQ